MFGFLKDDVNSVSVNEIDSLIGKIELIDIREPYEYKGGCLKGSKNIPMNTLLSNPDKYLEKTKTYHLMCLSGSRSSQACRYLKKMGYDVVNVKGGIGMYRGNMLK